MVILGGIILCIRQRHKRGEGFSISPFWLFTAILAMTLFLIFAWYNQVSSSERFVLGLMPIGFIGISIVTVKVLRKLSTLEFLPYSIMQSCLRMGKFVFFFVVMASCFIKISTLTPRNPFLTDRNDPLTDCLISILPTLSLTTKLAVNSLDYVPLWLEKTAQANTVEMPGFQNENEWAEFMRDTSIQWILIAGREEIANSEFYRAHFEMSQDGELSLNKPFTHTRFAINLGPQAVLLKRVSS